MPTRWYILIGIVAWPLSCVLVYFLASDVGYSRAVATVESRASETPETETTTRARPGRRGAAQASLRTVLSPRAMVATGSIDDSDRPARHRSALQRLVAATALRNRGQQQAELMAVTSEFTLNEVLEALEQIRRMEPGPAQDRMLRAIMVRWAQLEPGDALTFALAEESPHRRGHYVDDVFRGWAMVDPTAALAYLEDPNTEEFDRSIYRSIFAGLGAADPDMALDQIAGMDVERYGRGLSMAVRELFMADPDAVIDWAGRLPEGALQRMVTPMIVDRWGRYDPEAALAWMESQGSTQDQRTLAELGDSWARIDPRGAMDWYDELPDDQKDPRIMNGIFDRWLRYEPDTAASWILEQPATEDLDRSLDRYVRSMARESPDLALEWAMVIVNDRRREAAINQVINPWLRARPESVIDYLQTSTLPEDVAQSLLIRAREVMDASQR